MRFALTMFRAAFLACLCSLPLQAQDGGQLYTLYCSACHGTDGKGATGGAFPPLAESPWVAGDPARAVKIVLQGLHGPVDVDGRTFNLEMPPQGGVLPDDQIAAILSFVRASWGNKETPVSADFVKATRAATTDRKTPWTGEELLKLHPLPVAAPPIANLTSQIYHGTWKDLPDFTTLKAINIEEEHDGLISVTHSDLTDLYALVWEGEISAPESGTFLFRIDADDAGRVIIDGKTVAEVRGVGAMDGRRAKQGKIDLQAGTHKIRVEYLEYYGNDGIALAWKGPGIASWKNLTDLPMEKAKVSIPVTPSTDRAVVYRNFIAGTTPRAIGIGFPGGVNLAYSADHLAPELVWTGDFIDGARHWIERGQGNQPPAGDKVVKLSGSPALSESARFRGYKLDPAGNPTFSVQIGKQFLLDTWKPGNSQGSSFLVRTLTAKGQGGTIDLLLSDQLPLKQTNDQEYELGDALRLHVEHAAPETRGGKTYLKLAPGQSATLTYRWK